MPIYEEETCFSGMSFILILSIYIIIYKHNILFVHLKFDKFETKNKKNYF
jgi:hypothetical protein